MIVYGVKKTVKELRTKFIMTQEEFANLLGVSFASINRWETGKHELTIKIKRKRRYTIVEKSLEEQNKELKKKLVETQRQLGSLNNQVDEIHKDSEKRMLKLSEEMEDLEGEVLLSTPMPEPTRKVDYEQKTEKTDRYNSYLLENETFGWEKIKEFSYKNGGYRFTMRRNMIHPNYEIWKENERLYNILRCLYWSFGSIKNEINKLQVTFADIASDPEYKLTGWRKVFGIRTKEQKEEIQSNVNEINKAYNAFKKETEDVDDYIFKQYYRDVFLKDLENKKDQIHPNRSYILEIMQRYKISYENGTLSMHIKSIRYDFTKKRVELLED